MIKGRLFLRGREIGGCRIRAAGPFQMFSLKAEVRRCKPSCRPPMEALKLITQQGRIDALPDQRVRKQILLTERAHQIVLQQLVRGPGGIVDEMANNLAGKPLAQNRSRLQGSLVYLLQSIEARQDDTMDRARDILLADLFGAL